MHLVSDCVIKLGIKTVFFDMDGTLVYVPPSLEWHGLIGAYTPNTLSKVYRKLGLSFSPDKIFTANEKVEERWFKKCAEYTFRTQNAFMDYHYELLKGLGVKDNLEILSKKAYNCWVNREEAGERLYPDVMKVLRELGERNIALGVLSSRFVKLSMKSLENHNIDGFFRVVIGPQMAGAPHSKRSPEMWRFALKEVNCESDEVLHVDDDYETGILGAKQAGIQPVLIDRKDVHSSSDDCIVIHELSEIPRLL